MTPSNAVSPPRRDPLFLAAVLLMTLGFLIPEICREFWRFDALVGAAGLGLARGPVPTNLVSLAALLAGLLGYVAARRGPLRWWDAALFAALAILGFWILDAVATEWAQYAVKDYPIWSKDLYRASPEIRRYVLTHPDGDVLTGFRQTWEHRNGYDGRGAEVGIFAGGMFSFGAGILLGCCRALPAVRRFITRIMSPGAPRRLRWQAGIGGATAVAMFVGYYAYAALMDRGSDRICTAANDADDISFRREAAEIANEQARQSMRAVVTRWLGLHAFGPSNCQRVLDSLEFVDGRPCPLSVKRFMRCSCGSQSFPDDMSCAGPIECLPGPPRVLRCYQ